MFNVQCSTFNVQRSMFNVQRSMFNVQRSMFNVQCSTFKDSHHPDARMRLMLLHILIERHRFLDHLLVNHRGIQQVEPVATPHGKAQMGNFEPLLVAGDGQYVAILHRLAQLRVVAQQALGNVAHLHARQRLLLGTDLRNQRRIGLQCLIGCGVR